MPRDIFQKINYKWCAGILETIFDGIQRPLQTIAEISGSVFVPRGVDLPCLDQKKMYDFQPQKLNVGDLITGGDMLGHVFENDLFSKHKIMAQPKANGRLKEIVGPGRYCVSDTIAVVETLDGKDQNLTMSHFWPVRSPRPCAEKLAPKTPLLTGQRVLDALFPTV